MRVAYSWFLAPLSLCCIAANPHFSPFSVLVLLSYFTFVAKTTSEHPLKMSSNNNLLQMCGNPGEVDVSIMIIGLIELSPLPEIHRDDKSIEYSLPVVVQWGIFPFASKMKKKKHEKFAKPVFNLFFFKNFKLKIYF